MHHHGSWNNSVESALCLLDVPSLVFWKIHEVDGSLVCYDRKSVVLDVEADGLKFLIHLDLGQAQITVPVLVQHFHETKSIKYNCHEYNTDSQNTYPDLALAPSEFLFKSPFENPNCLV